MLKEQPSILFAEEPTRRLRLRKLSGDSFSLPYDALLLIQFEPGQIRLEFSGGAAFTLYGACLEHLFDVLQGQLAAEVHEVDPSGDEALKNLVLVTSIQPEWES